MSTGAALARGKSKQDYATPPCFMEPVLKRFGPLSWDLAASAGNTKAANFYSEVENSLVQSWHDIGGTLWLNPPFDNITPWAEKCKTESQLGARILFLTPASVGSNWFDFYVHRHAFVLAVRPRLSFDMKNPYPKDIILSCYGFGAGFDTWKWQ